MKNALFILCLFLFPLEMVAQFENYKMDWTKISNESQYNSEPEWLKDAKFGIYFHWGVYSVPAYSYEWYPRLMFMENRKEYKYHKEHYGDPKKVGYEALVPLFKAEKFNAKSGSIYSSWQVLNLQDRWQSIMTVSLCGIRKLLLGIQY